MTADGKLTITADVKNTGSVAGAEVLQLYISDTKSSQPRPVKELKGFKKVSLAPGETQQVDFTIDRSALSFYDEQTGEWTAEPGEFVAIVNNSSAPTKNKIRFILSSKTAQGNNL
jgi:beta-glucosidase